MSEEINIKFYDPEVEELRKENQQLKEKYLNAVSDYETTKSENQQLLETSKAYKKLLKTTMQKEHQAIKVLDEIREYITQELDDPDPEFYREYTVDESWFNDLLQILDKVKSND